VSEVCAVVSSDSAPEGRQEQPAVQVETAGKHHT
jgi:hypothetical protein